jgi:hypothetical protein
MAFRVSPLYYLSIILGWLLPLLAVAGERPPGFDEIDLSVEIGTVVTRMAFDVVTLEAAPEARLQLTLKNTDIMQHNWVLCRPGKKTQ